MMLEVRGSARLLRQEPHPAGRRHAYRRRRGRQPAGAQRCRPLDDGQGDHGRGAAAGLDQIQGQRHRRACRATGSRIWAWATFRSIAISSPA